MRLQDKKIITSDFASQKKAQIDEGVQIARKVDVLRETLASLETQYATMLAGSRKNLEFAIADLVEKKANVEGELRKLEERRDELNKIIDEKYAVSNEEKINFANKLADVTLKELQLNEREDEIKKTEETINETLRSAEESRIESERQKGLAEKDRAASIEIREEAKRDKETQSRGLESLAEDLTKREREVETQRLGWAMRKRDMDIREKGLDEKEKAINDKYQTLIDTITRFNKK